MPFFTCRAALAQALAVFMLSGCQAYTPVDDSRDANPEAATGTTTQRLYTARHYVAATANPLATRAASDILAQGGSAVDAAIAAQMVLTLVEPQSSGIGGGAFLMHYAAGNGQVTFIDGRETAPAGSGPALFMNGSRPIRFMDAVNSGKSVGVPGVLRALELAHRRHGKLPWPRLFDSAIQLASEGFVVSPRLAQLIKETPELSRQVATKRNFFHPDGSPLKAGDTLRNPDLANTLQQIAESGADVFYRGELARDMVAAVAGHARPGTLSAADLADYTARERAPLCTPYRIYVVCGAAPPSAGGIAIAQMLGILAHTPIAAVAPDSVQAVHYFSEAGRLAYADRDRYVADPNFEKVPTQALVAPDYLARRAALISPTRAMSEAAPGNPVEGLPTPGIDDTPELPSTSHLSIVDGEGNAVAMTSSIEQAFGSKIMVGGFLLNNELTDFSLSPRDAQARPIANRVEPGKRPRSTMAPTIVLERTEAGFRLRLVAGSPGGTAIVNYVAKTLIANLDWGLDIQASVTLPHRGSRNHSTEIESGTELESLVPALTALGHHVTLHEFPSGVQAIAVLPDGTLQSGTDPRRESSAMGR